MRWEASVCLSPNWLTHKVLQHVMPCVASDDGWVVLLIPSWPRHPWTFCLFCGRPIWLQDRNKTLISDLCCITWSGCWVVLDTYNSLLLSSTRLSSVPGKMVVKNLLGQMASFPSLCSMSSLFSLEVTVLHTPSFLFFPAKSCQVAP